MEEKKENCKHELKENTNESFIFCNKCGIRWMSNYPDKHLIVINPPTLPQPMLPNWRWNEVWC